MNYYLLFMAVDGHFFLPVSAVGGTTKNSRYGKLLQNTEIDSQNTESLFMGCTGLAVAFNKYWPWHEIMCLL